MKKLLLAPLLVVFTFTFVAAPLWAQSRSSDRGYADSAPQPEKAQLARKGQDTEPRKAKPKPKPKPPKEGGEKGGTEDINIGVGELQE